ncbi:MAG: hypothetical protein NVSMB67_05380 [Flavisolibacter sp.]
MVIPRPEVKKRIGNYIDHHRQKPKAPLNLEAFQQGKKGKTRNDIDKDLGLYQCYQLGAENFEK